MFLYNNIHMQRFKSEYDYMISRKLASVQLERHFELTKIFNTSIDIAPVLVMGALTGTHVYHKVILRHSYLGSRDFGVTSLIRRVEICSRLLQTLERHSKRHIISEGS